ncbi:hypothetical protein BC332_13831 [Capsicum chinense]|nr:hypothetical protein BC332_13831 [Capsicum chinense]
MPGIGHFGVRAWCTVDQEHNEKKLLQKIFNQVIGSKERFSEDGIYDNIADNLRKQLFGKRYLIVLDDLWDTATWYELTRPFPSELHKGSKFILPSQKKKVILNFRLLRLEENWELLQKRVFKEEYCTDKFKYVGGKIAVKCDGLPLVLDLVSGVISKMEKKEALQHEVLNNMSSFIFKDEEESAEGLMEHPELKVYVDELISSILVVVSNERDLMPRGMTVHYDQHFPYSDANFFLLNAKKENLMSNVSFFNEAKSSSSIIFKPLQSRNSRGG